MARLPQPGGDSGNWGVILNDYLSQAHKPNGSLKDGAVSGAAIADGSVSAAKFDSAASTDIREALEVPHITGAQTIAVVATTPASPDPDTIYIATNEGSELAYAERTGPYSIPSSVTDWHIIPDLNVTVKTTGRPAMVEVNLGTVKLNGDWTAYNIVHLNLTIHDSVTDEFSTHARIVLRDGGPIYAQGILKMRLPPNTSQRTLTVQVQLVDTIDGNSVDIGTWDAFSKPYIQVIEI